MEPTDGPLNNPAINAQTTAMLGITFRQDRFDALLPQHLAMRLRVVGAISLHSARPFAGRPRLPRTGGIASTKGSNCVTS